MSGGAFFDRLRRYFEDVGAVLRDGNSAARVFPNTTDNGMSRERLYAEFLKLHLPASCVVSYGGFVFGLDGAESRQIDIIVASDVSPRFDFHNKDGSGKSFSCVDGTLGVFSIKARLTSSELTDALDNIASVPEQRGLAGRINPALRIDRYEDWPFKVIYAPTGVTPATALSTISAFYSQRPVPPHRRPNLIHIGNDYTLTRDPNLPPGTCGVFDPGIDYILEEGNGDTSGLPWVVASLLRNAALSRHIMFEHGAIVNALSGLSRHDFGPR